MRALRRSDSGAAAIIVAIVVGCFLIGMSALAIDVGSFYVERRQLQNGADAGALAVAASCVKSTCDTSKAQSYANANAKDGTSNLDGSVGPAVCGTFAGLPTCSTPTLPAASQVYDCAEPPPASGIQYVQVRTSTRQQGGSTVIPPFLARALPGNSSYAGTTVHACARAAVAPASGGFGFAATISECEWQAMTQNGQIFAPPPPYPPNPASSAEVNLELHDGQASSSNYPCPTGYGAGADLPGGFGWLDDPSGTCTADIDTSNDYGASPGVGISAACKALLTSAITNHTILYMPVYDSVVGGSGQNGTYSLAGFAAFVPTGFNLPGSGNPSKLNSWLTGNACYTVLGGTSQLKCLSGFFTQGLIPAGQIGGSGGNLPGVSVLQLIR